MNPDNILHLSHLDDATRSSHSGCAPLSVALNHGDQINKLVAGLDFLVGLIIKGNALNCVQRLFCPIMFHMSSLAKLL